MPATGPGGRERIPACGRDLLPAQVLRDTLEHLMLHVGEIGQYLTHEFQPSPAGHRIQFGVAKVLGWKVRSRHSLLGLVIANSSLVMMPAIVDRARCLGR
jgi:hypothetical protein